MAKAGRKYSINVNTERENSFIRRVRKHLSRAVVGQPKAINHLVKLLTSVQSGLRDPRRPIGTVIFAGPSDCGKTFTAKVLSQALLGDQKGFNYPLTAIQCQDLSECHRVSTLIGAPPGYVDSHKIPALHRYNIEKYGLISFLEREIESCNDDKQKKEKKEALKQVKRCLRALQVGQATVWQDKQQINAYSLLNKFFDRVKPIISIILFDEIEKAHPDVWNLLLGIIEDGQLQLANNGEVTNFGNSLIILTTNTGSREIQGVLGANKIGFAANKADDPEKLDQVVHNEAKKALERMFPRELMTRLGKGIIAFRSLRKDDFDKIFCQMAEEIRQRLNNAGISMRCTSGFRKYIVEKIMSQKAGPRMLRDEIKDCIETPVSAAFSSQELKAGDKIIFLMENGKPILRRRPRLKAKKIKITQAVKEEKKQIEVRNNGHDKEANRGLF